MEQAASPSSSCTGDRLEDMMQKLRMRESESRARILLEDMSVLRAWQQQSKEKRGASHATRNSMLKVATRWSVQRKLAGKHRLAADVAQELENCMIRAAESIIEKRSSQAICALLLKRV